MQLCGNHKGPTLVVSCVDMMHADGRQASGADNEVRGAGVTCGWIKKDGRYITPKSDTILQSTTNIMLQQLARDRGMIVEERPIDFHAEISNFKEIGSSIGQSWRSLQSYKSLRSCCVFVSVWLVGTTEACAARLLLW